MNFPKEIESEKLDELERKLKRAKTAEFCARLILAVSIIAMLLCIAHVTTLIAGV